MSDLPSDISTSEYYEVLRRLVLPTRLRGASLSSMKLIFALPLLLFLGSACSSKKKVEVQNLQVNPDSLYTVRTLSLNTLISDSGIIRYRMTAPELLIYERNEKSNRTQWVFPQGLILRPYDSKQSRIFIKADSAVRDPLQEAWELVGNVLVQGPEGQRLTTHRLFWLRDQRELYSNDTTNFLVQGRELRGSHFRAKDDLSWYEIYDNKGAFDFEEKPVGSPAPTSPSTSATPPANTDSISRVQVAKKP